MSTVAKTVESNGSHWYEKTGEPRHVIDRSDGKGQRPTTLRDARKYGWLPSVTNVLRAIDKPMLNTWKTEMACLAVLTAPRKEGEELDAFVHRVLHVERQQDQEAARARDKGVEVHDAIEHALKGQSIPDGMAVYVDPVIAELKQFGEVMATERIVVGDGYAGKLDAMLKNKDITTILDFKTTKTLPKYGSWSDNKLQLSAYAQAVSKSEEEVQTANLYISTTEPGKVVLDVHDDWWATYRDGFLPVLWYWSWANDYKPHIDWTT